MYQNLLNRNNNDLKIRDKKINNILNADRKDLILIFLFNGEDLRTVESKMCNTIRSIAHNDDMTIHGSKVICIWIDSTVLINWKKTMSDKDEKEERRKKDEASKKREEALKKEKEELKKEKEELKKREEASKKREEALKKENEELKKENEELKGKIIENPKNSNENSNSGVKRKYSNSGNDKINKNQRVVTRC